MIEVKQCAKVRAKQSFDASINRRRVHVKAGDVFWITSTKTYAAQYGVVDIAREGKGGIGGGYPFTIEKFNELFEAVSHD